MRTLQTLIRASFQALLVAGALPTGPALSQTITHLADPSNSCVSVPQGTTSHVLTLNGAIAAGNTIIISATTSDYVTQTPAIFDSTGINSYTLDKSYAPFAPIGPRVFAISSRTTAALAMGQSITIPYMNNTGMTRVSCAVVSVFSNLAGNLDQVGSASGGTATLFVQTSGATAQGNELVMGVFQTNAATTFMAGSLYTATPGPCSTSCVFPEFKIVASPGVPTATGTLGGNTTWLGIVATYTGCETDSQSPIVTAPAGVTVIQTTCM